MKLLTGAVVSLVLASFLHALNEGDTLEQVFAEKGKPVSRAEAGPVVILNYSDCSVQFRDGLVSSIKSKAQAQGPITHAVSPSVSAAKPVRAIASDAAGSTENAGWVTDVKGALSQAQAQNKHVFLFFTGSDWCGWCKRLDREILSTDDFKHYAADNLILVELDFPRHHPQAEDLKTQNEQLAAQFRIQGFPTVIVLDGNGRPVGKLGYQEGGPGPFIHALQRL